MKNRKTFALLLAILVVSSISVGLISRRGQSQNQSPNKRDQQQLGDDSIPIVDYDAPEPVDPEDRRVRKARGRKYKSELALQKLDSGGSLFDDPNFEGSIEPAIPVKESDLIIQGTVTDAKAFISNDKSAVYSEFRLAVDLIFKNIGHPDLGAGSVVTCERAGGKVRFPSGAILRRGESGHNLPSGNHQYVLFLKWDVEGSDYVIQTGYRVEGKIVNPLDGFGSNSPRIFSEYARFKNASYSDFISQLEQAVASSSTGKDL